MSTDLPPPQAVDPKAEEPAPVGSSSATGNISQLNGDTVDVEMNGTHEQTKDKEGEKEKEKENGEGKDQDRAGEEEELNKIFAARREEEMARRDRSLAEFLVMLDGYKPLVCLVLNASFMKLS
jgi:hypothetical protein